MEKELLKIEDMCSKITDGSHFSPEDNPSAEYPMYSVKDMEYNGFNDSDCKMINRGVFEKLSRSDCRPLKNDILIAKDGSYLKYVFKVKETLDACILSSIAILRPNNIINPDYLVYLMRLPSVRGAMANYVSGSALPRIILSDFKKMKLEVFNDLAYQQKVANILSKYDELIELNNKRIKLLEQTAEELYKEWFVRFRFPNYQNTEFEEDIPNGWHFGDETNKMRPKGWEYAKFERIGSFKRGKNITASEMVVGDIPVVSAGIEPSGYHNQSNVIGKSLTLSASGANAGYLRYNLDDIWAADCLYYQNDDIIWFVYNTLRFLQPVISNMQCGAAQPHVYPKNIARLCMILPPKTVMDKFCQITSPFYDEIKQLKQQNEILIKQRDLLLPRLMSGKLSVETKTKSVPKVKKVISFDDFRSNMGMAARAKTISDKDLIAMYEAYIDDNATE